MRARIALVGAERFDRDGLDLHKTSSPFEAPISTLGTS
jgi:hypothetical protein